VQYFSYSIIAYYVQVVISSDSESQDCPDMPDESQDVDSELAQTDSEQTLSFSSGLPSSQSPVSGAASAALSPAGLQPLPSLLTEDVRAQIEAKRVAALQKLAQRQAQNQEVAEAPTASVILGPAASTRVCNSISASPSVMVNRPLVGNLSLSSPSANASTQQFLSSFPQHRGSLLSLTPAGSFYLARSRGHVAPSIRGAPEIVDLTED
jgi:hypothetical protein